MTYLQKKIKYVPNILTILRIIFIPLFIFFLFKEKFIYQFFSLIIFIIASITDYIDGQIARKYQIETRLGRFLDPLADKLLVLSAFISFGFIKQLNIPLWIGILFGIRELIITLLRVFAIVKGGELKTSFWGKLKTTTQMITIIFTLSLYSIGTFLIERKFVGNWTEFKNLNIMNFILHLPLIFTFISLIITYYSGLLYVISNKKHL